MKVSRVGFIVLLGLAACKGKATEGTGGSAPAEKAADLATSADPAGIQWKKVERPFGTIEAPVPYELADDQLEAEDGTVVMLQSQNGITPDQIDDYMASYDDVQKRDAPKYGGATTTKGKVGGAVAARVDATFDNGTQFVTRDFVIFTKGKVIMLSSRTPTSNAAALPGVIDHIARSLVVK